MVTSPIDKIIADTKSNLAAKIRIEANISEEKIDKVIELAKESFIRLLQSEAAAGHFEEFLKIYNGVASTLSITQITSLLEYFYAKKLRENLKFSNLEAEKTVKIISPFLIKQINTKKIPPATDIKTLCTQLGLEDCILDLEALKKRWDDLSPEEKKQFSH